MRVATSFLSDAAIRSMQQGNVELEKTTYQVSSGYKTDRFKEIATDTGQLLNLQDLRLNNDQYLENISTAKSRLNSTENALQGLADLVVEAANLWTLSRNENSAEVRANLAPKAEALAETFFNIFQTTYDGRYIFSGAAGEKPPITAAPTANTFPGLPGPTAYYTGDTQRMLVNTAPGVVQEYGINGDHEAFANLKAGLEALWFGLENNSETDIDGAIDLLNDSQSEIGSILGQIGGQMAGFTLVSSRHEDANIFLQDRIDELEKVDVAEAITLFNQQQAVIEASMMVLTRISGLTLLNFMR